MRPRVKLVSIAAIVTVPSMFVPFPTRIAAATNLRFVRDDGVLGRAFRMIAVHASYGSNVSLEFELPPGIRVKFEDNRFRKWEPFNTSRSYLDRAKRSYFPQEKNDVQRVIISGDFSGQGGYLEIPLRSKTPNRVQ